MKKILLSAALMLITYSQLFAYLTQGHFRWRNNDGSETSATWKAPLDSTIKISDNKAIRLRLDIDNAQTAVKSLSRSLAYATSPSGPWYNITNNSAINAFNMAGDNGYIHNNDSTTLQIVDTTYAFLRGNIVTLETLYGDTIPVGHRREYEWCIKPTALALPNTTYYFESTIGSTPEIFATLTTTGPAFVNTAAPAILTNGGFENNLTGWTTAAINGSAATYNITTAPLHVHGGSKALVVNVTNTGSASNSVTLTATPFATTDTGYYLLRFWALSTTQNALLDINLQSGANGNPCHYEIRTRIDTTQNGWVLYQYAFKAPQSPVTLQINFNSVSTYYLDDVEVINSVTNPNYNVRMQYDWQNNFAETYGWISGDNDNPVLLPDGRVAWVYNDSFFGPNNPHTNVIPNAVVPHNLLVVQKGDSLKSVYGGTPPNPVSLFDPGNGNEFWQAGGLVENGQLKVVLIEVANQSSYAGYTWIGSMNLPDLTVSTLHRLPATINTGPNCVFTDSTYDYLYFGSSSSSDVTFTVVGRVPAGQLDSQTAWQFYTGNGVWSTNFALALNIVDGVSAANVIKLGPNNYVLSGVPYVSQEIDVWFAQNPWGPWVNKTTIYNIPPEESVLPYEGHMYPIPNKGIYTFSWSLYPFNNDSGNEQLADKTIYVPDYAQADLLALSPFSQKYTNNFLTSISASSQGRNVTELFSTSQPNEDKITIQQSVDNNNWTDVATVDSSNKTTNANSYKAIFTNPKNGLNYFRMELFDEDDVLSISPVKSYNLHENANISSFTAAAASANQVNIAFSTSAETLNEGFVLQNSTDSLHWKTLTEIQGAGTVLQTSNYQATDNAPVLGLNYYRIGYYSAGNPTITSTVKVDTRQVGTAAIVLNVYPNPGPSTVNFNLKGYQGKTFTATLTSLYGKQFGTKTFTANEGQTYTLPTTATTGMYILNINGDNLKQVSRVLVQ